MSRAYHSASSVALGRRCPRAWAYCYIDGLRDEDVPWAEIEAGREVPSRIRSLSLGKAVHAIGEAYYRGELVRWESLPGQIYASGMGLLPAPSECPAIEVEHPLGDTPCVQAPAGVVLHAGGVAWAGFRDLYVVTRVGAPLQIDYKTTSKIGAWSHTPATLHDDLQCALYTYDLCQRLGEPVIASRWLYLETKRVRRALAVDVTMSRDHAMSTIESAAEFARTLDRITSSADAEQRTDACYAYGGCHYHRSAGGPCDAQRSIKAAIAHRSMSTMALDPGLMAKFGALAKPAAAPPPPPPAEASAPAATAPEPPAAVEAPPVAAPAPAPAAFGGRKRAPKTEAAPAPAPASTLAAQLADAIAALAAADAARTEALTRIAALASEALV